MINDEFSLQLTQNVANALLERITGASSDALVSEDLDRLRRLVAAGHLSKKVVRQALHNVANNEALSAGIRESAAAEVADDFQATAIKSANSGEAGLRPYRSADTLLPTDWPIDRLENCGWTRFTDEQATNFLSDINPVDGRIRVTPRTTAVHFRPLPWYESEVLIRVRDPDWQTPNLALYYLSCEKSLMRLNGTAHPIHEVNAKAPIRLTDLNALDYLRFFCFFVRSDEGPFFIPAGVADPLLPAASIAVLSDDAKARLSLAKLMHIDEHGKFRCEATVYYGNALFNADFSVAPTGMIEMHSDSPICGDLPERIQAPLA
ncbi:MAG TPA: hypothetical protein VGE36_11180 [Roseateles sp.]